MKMYSNWYLFASLLLVVALFGCSKDDDAPSASGLQCGKVFYYYENEKIYLEKSVSKMTIGLADTLTDQQIVEALSSYSSLLIPEPELINPERTLVMVGLRNRITCGQIESLSAALVQNQAFNFAHQMLKFNNSPNDMQGITNEFFVKLRDTADYYLLENLATQTHVSISPYTYNPTVFILNINKNSTMNALDLANHFHESGNFDWAAPNFLLILSQQKGIR